MSKTTLEMQIVAHVLKRAAEYETTTKGKDRIAAALVDEVRELIAVSPGVSTLRGVLERMRWDDQGGYSGRHNGKWSFVSTSLPQTTPTELDRMFALAGIVPDEIRSLGSCSECANAKINADGSRSERGYAGKCSPCKRPRMSNFVPLHVVTQSTRRARAR